MAGIRGAQVGQVRKCGVQRIGQLVRGVAGAGQIGARGRDDPAGPGAGVGPDPAVVVANWSR